MGTEGIVRTGKGRDHDDLKRKRGAHDNRARRRRNHGDLKREGGDDDDRAGRRRKQDTPRNPHWSIKALNVVNKAFGLYEESRVGSDRRHGRRNRQYYD